MHIAFFNLEHGEVMPTDSSAMQGILERYGILDAVTDPNCTLMDGTAIQLNIGDLNTDQVIADFDLAFERLSQEVCGLIRDALFTGLVGVPISDPGVVLMAEPADSCHLPKSESRPIRRVRTAQDVLTVVQPLLMRESLGA